jgi:putative sigma-54 modulation protein
MYIYIIYEMCYNRQTANYILLYKNSKVSEMISMKITITGRKVTLKESFKERVEKKLQKFEKFFDEDADAHVTVTVEKDRQTVEITIKNVGTFYRAEHTAEDMLFSLDDAVDTLMKQINKNKTRLIKRLKVGAFDNEPFIEQDSESEFDIVKTKRFKVKPMDIEEAILQMNLLGHEFYTFINTKSALVNVVYRRHDGKYGVLEPVLD